jgi:hypothetical protein
MGVTRQITADAAVAFLGFLGVMLCIPGIFLLWIAGTIALRLEE